MIAAAGLIVSLLMAFMPEQVIVARDSASGRVRAIARITTGDSFSLTYVHSVYRQPAREEFTVTGSGFTLTRIASGSEAVVEYYARPEAVVLRHGEYEVRPRADTSTQFSSLSLLASRDGARTLVVGGRSVPLHQPGSDGNHVVLSVMRLPRVLRWARR